MSESKFDEVIALAGLCTDDMQKLYERLQARANASATLGAFGVSDDAYALHLRVQQLYMNLCTLAAEHGNPSAQRILSLVGKHLASLAGPHGAPDIERDEQ